MDSLILESFTPYQQILSPTLHSKWDDIVQEHCFTAGWIDENDVPSPDERGWDWDTLQACLCLHLLMVYKNDVAEHHHLYMNVTIKKPWHTSIKTFHKRLKELDALAPMLSCLKDDPDCLAEAESMDLPLTPVIMCNLLMRVTLPLMKDEYNCMNDLLLTDAKKRVQ